MCNANHQTEKKEQERNRGVSLGKHPIAFREGKSQILGNIGSRHQRWKKKNKKYVLKECKNLMETKLCNRNLI